MDLESVRAATSIVVYLMQEGELTRQKDATLYDLYNEPNVSETINIMKREMNVDILKINGSIYIIPNAQNEYLGIKKQDFKKLARTSKRQQGDEIDYFISSYIIITIIIKFYSGKNINPKVRTSLNIEDVERYITERLTELAQKSDVKIIEHSNSINIVSVYNRWYSMINDIENKYLTRTEFIKRVCSFLEVHKLIKYFSDEEIIETTKKFDDLITFYMDYDRKIIIENILNSEVIDNA